MTDPLPAKDKLDDMVENAEPIDETTSDVSQPSGWNPKTGGEDEGPTVSKGDKEDPGTMMAGGQSGG